MITALQNFISSRGKFVFVLLLIVVVVAFVLYLAQGASVFDLLPDPNREKKEFYGVDLNDPEQMRVLNYQNRVASDFGAVIPPLEESIENADKLFSESLQGRLQAAFQAGRENMDQGEIQRLFSFIQSWPNLPKNFKVREIARSGFYEPVFSQATIKALLVMLSQANQWGYLSENDNHQGINDGFNDYVRELDPVLFNSDENRTRILQFVAARQGVRIPFVESVLYTHFRANQVDQIYSDGAFTLEKEGELDLFSNQFAWNADILSLNSNDLNMTVPELFSIVFKNQPGADDIVEIEYGSTRKSINFVEEKSENNSSVSSVVVGPTLKETIKRFVDICNDFDFELKKVGTDKLNLIPDVDNLPSAHPKLSIKGESIIATNEFEEKLKSFHDLHKNDSEYIEPARTFATMISFPTNKFLTLAPEPSESRMKSYFEQNRDQFESLPEVPSPDESLDGEKGPVGENDTNKTIEGLNLIESLNDDLNKTDNKDVRFEDVKEEIRLRIIEEDRMDAERDAKELARETSLKFLDDLNSLRDKLKAKYSTYPNRRNSEEINDLISKSGGDKKPISFADRDMGVQAAILGIERRESERRSNREPLEEVANLNEVLFFTRSIRTVRDGFAVFLLDRKVEEKAGQYDSTSFSALFKGFLEKRKLDTFNRKSDQVFSGLEADENNQTLLESGDYLSIDGKGSDQLQQFYGGKNQRLRNRLNKLEEERNQITSLEREDNATSDQLKRKNELDLLIENIRDEQDKLNKDRSLAIQLSDACQNLEVGAGWSELERTDQSVVFVRLKGVYSVKKREAEKTEILTRVQDLENARADKNRDLILETLINQELAEKSED